MNKCPQCGKPSPDTFRYCPDDGTLLKGAPPPARIRVSTLVLGVVVLFLIAGISFAGVYLYQYYKPKYGGLAIKTSPSGVSISIDGKLRGVSPLNLAEMRSGGYLLKAEKEGYSEIEQQVIVMPYATQNLHIVLEPIVTQLSNKQMAQIESWRRQLDNAFRENILYPPPDDYNVLYFADMILSVDPTNKYASDVKARLADNEMRRAEIAYAREDWLEVEKHYQRLAIIYPQDPSVGERLQDVAVRIEESFKDRELQIMQWRENAEKAFSGGRLLPPSENNAYDAIRNIQRLDKNNAYAHEATLRLKELLQGRGDEKIAAGNWIGARQEFSGILQFFPEDNYSRTRLSTVNARIEETAKRDDRPSEEQLLRQWKDSTRQSAIKAFSQKDYEKSILYWHEYLKLSPESDEAHYYLGANHQNLQQLDTAIYNYERSVSLNPGNVHAHLNLGRLYDYHRNNYSKAEEHLLKARDLGGAEGFSPERLQAMIQELRSRTAVSEFTRLSFPVEHRHIISGCRGQINFTREGIEFRTTETDHSFHETYRQLRLFELRGNELSIRTGDNRRYNFVFINAADADRLRSEAGITKYFTSDSQ
ncbi:MAG TPA: PEGA domain-containing protein [Acidobacteriota bacterium]|nr:PEGA domain-containing protein [Acidobacteriota bacterium]